MYERFTDRARKVMQLANQEAQRFNHEYIGTEHILLGLVKEGSGVGANVLKYLGVELSRVRLQVERILTTGPDDVVIGSLPQTPRAKKVIEYSAETAANLGRHYVGTEHLLLGLLREEEGVAAQVLTNLGLNLNNVREEVLSLQGSSPVLTARQRKFAEVELDDLPTDVRRIKEELDTGIERLNQEKEDAVAESQFDRAAHLRDEADKLKKRKAALLANSPTAYPIDPSWLSLNGGTTASIARVIKELSRWDDLPVLADALEDAGCADREILSHCRQSLKHGSRCWVVDLLLRQL